jgi:hypothetical protein
MTKKLKQALKVILDLVQSPLARPTTLHEAKGLLAIIEVIADSVLDEVAEEEKEKAA